MHGVLAPHKWVCAVSDYLLLAIAISHTILTVVVIIANVAYLTLYRLAKCASAAIHAQASLLAKYLEWPLITPPTDIADALC